MKKSIEILKESNNVQRMLLKTLENHMESNINYLSLISTKMKTKENKLNIIIEQYNCMIECLIDSLSNREHDDKLIACGGIEYSIEILSELYEL